MDRRAITLLGFGHVADDINQSFLPALLPLLGIELHLNYAAVASLVFGQAISSSVVQPAIGYLADKRPMPWLSGVGLLLAGGGIAAIGFMHQYVLVFLCALISGLGVAMWHPEAARFANLASGSRKASGMRWFAVGGNVGFAIGPGFASLAIAAFGLRGTFLAAIPVVIMATLILLEVPRLRTFLPKVVVNKVIKPIPDDWSAFGRLTAYIIFRSMAYIGLVSFIPLYFVHVVGLSTVAADMVLTTFLVAGLIGTIVGGPLADKHGRLAVINWSMGATLLFLGILALVTNEASMFAIVAGFILAFCLGAMITGSQAAAIVLGQEYLPNRIGVASGVSLGLAVSIGGMFTPVLGRIGDAYGLHATIVALFVLTAIAMLLGFFMPDPTKRRAKILARRAALV
jgi:FSR family fosmidomycin resistance protein-like MFS transporter